MMLQDKHMLRLFIGMFAAVVALGLSACSDDASNPVTPTQTSELDQIVGAAHTYLSSSASPTMTATALYNNINDGNAANDPYVLCVRSAADYAIGHVPGAVNVPFKDVAKSASLALLPANRQIVVVCYTGHTASQTAMFLNMMGYDAVALKFGMAAWNVDPAHNPSVATNPPFDSALDCGEYPVSTVSVTPGSHTLPSVDNTGSTAASEVVRVAADLYLSSGKAPVIKAVDVYNNLNDGNAANDPLILSVRSAADYALGHVTGAVNIPWKNIADKAELAKLPTDRQIVVACYSGHTASFVTLFLSTLGYDAAALKFGMHAWTLDPADNPSVTTSPCYDSDVDCGDYPCEP